MIRRPFSKSYMTTHGRIVLGIYLILAFADLPLRSQDTLQFQWDRFSVSLGGFLTSNSSNLSLEGQEMGLGVSLDLEDALGLTTTTLVFRGEVEYNFGTRKRSYVRMGYFGFIRNANKTLETELELGDNVYPLGTELASSFDMHIIRALYDYAYFKDDRIRLGLSAGLYVLPLSFSISTDTLLSESDSFIAPLPVFGFQNSIYITPKILLKQNIELLYLKTSELKGSINDINVWIEYNPFKHLGFGMGYNSFRFNFTAQGSIGKRDFNGSVSTGFSGMLFYGKYYF